MNRNPVVRGWWRVRRISSGVVTDLMPGIGEKNHNSTSSGQAFSQRTREMWHPAGRSHPPVHTPSYCAEIPLCVQAAIYAFRNFSSPPTLVQRLENS